MNRPTILLLTLLLTLHLQAQDETTAQADSTVQAPRPVLALKTNLLGDLALGVNVEAEIPLDSLHRWSLMGEYWTPWYVWHHNSRAYELQVVSLELRHWFTERSKSDAFCGWFAGAYFGAGKYDFEWNSSGDQGEFLSGGFSGGYCWRLSRCFRLEASAALGILWGPRSHYSGHFNDTHLLWEYDKHDLYLGPTKLKLSLVWIINKKKKGGRA